jgi:hypothetical protein
MADFEKNQCSCYVESSGDCRWLELVAQLPGDYNDVHVDNDDSLDLLVAVGEQWLETRVYKWSQKGRCGKDGLATGEIGGE